MVANATYIGIGEGGAENVALNLRDNSGVKYYNSVFVDYARMIFIEDDNVDRFDAGDIVLQSSVWYSHIAENNTAEGFNANPDPSTQLVDPTVFWTDTAFNNQIADPLLASISRTDDGMLDPRPGSTSPALDATKLTDLPDDGWFVATDYAGAFAPTGPTWAQGWTKLSTEGYLTQAPLEPASGAMNNISNRGQVGTGEAVQIAGFAIPESAGRTIGHGACGRTGPGRFRHPESGLRSGVVCLHFGRRGDGHRDQRQLGFHDGQRGQGA